MISWRLNRNLTLLWIGQFISLCGDAALWATIIYMVLALDPPNAAAKSGFVAFLEMIPYLLLGIFAGVIGDRFDRKRILWVSDFMRAGILMVVPAAYFGGWLSWQVVGAVAFGIGAFTALFNPARDALLPDLATGEELIRINSFFQTSGQFAIIAGTGLATAFLGISRLASRAHDVFRLTMIFTADGLTYAVSGAFILAIAAPRLAGISGEPPVAFRGQLGKLKTWIREDSLLAGLLFITAVDNFFIMGPATVGMNLLVKYTLNKGPEVVALYQFVLALGMLVSSMALLKWGHRFPKGKLVLAGILLDGLTFFPFFFLRSFHWILAAVFIHSLTIPVIIVPRTTLIQENVPREKLAQAFALVNLTIFGFWSLSGLITGWGIEILGEYVSPPNAPPAFYLMAGLGGALSGMAGFAFKRLREAR